MSVTYGMARRPTSGRVPTAPDTVDAMKQQGRMAKSASYYDGMMRRGAPSSAAGNRKQASAVISTPRMAY